MKKEKKKPEYKIEEYKIDSMSMTTKFVVNNMLSEGFLLHSIAAAIGADLGALADFIDRHIGVFSKAYHEGYAWREAHSMREWPDYVVNKELVGRKSVYWEKIPWHAEVRTDVEPRFAIDNECINKRLHFMSFGSNIN